MNADLFIADMVTMRLESIEERRRLGSEPERNGGFVFGGGGGGGRGGEFWGALDKQGKKKLEELGDFFFEFCFF